MLPLNDVEPNRYTPFSIMTVLIILVNTAVFVYERVLLLESPQLLYTWFQLYGTVPALVISREGGGAITAVTHLFLHSDLLHLFGNMLGLWVFGRRVEDVCGPWRFLMFYLACGFSANILHTAVEFDSTIPGIGASGALFGVMGAYLILFPRGRIRTLVPVLGLPLLPKIRAYWLIPYFLVLEFLPAFLILFQDAAFGVAHWAHLGGFFSGLFIFLFLRAEAFHRLRNDLPL